MYNTLCDKLCSRNPSATGLKYNLSSAADPWNHFLCLSGTTKCKHNYIASIRNDLGELITQMVVRNISTRAHCYVSFHDTLPASLQSIFPPHFLVFLFELHRQLLRLQAPRAHNILHYQCDRENDCEIILRSHLTPRVHGKVLEPLF